MTITSRWGYFIALGLLVPGVASAGILPGCLSNQVFFDPTGTVQFFDVPDGVSQMSAYVRAASGGIGDGTNEGGFGASAHIQFTVTPGETLTLVVGAPGGDAAAQSFCGGGGGGASAIARAGFVPLAVMGGGGGGGSYDANHSVSDASLTPTGNAGDGADGGAAGVGTQGGAGASGAGGGGASTAGGDVVGGGQGGATLSGAATGGAAGAGGAAGGFGGGGGTGGTQGCAGGGGGGGYSGGGGGGQDDAGSGSGGGGGTFIAPEVTILGGPTPGVVPSPGQIYLCYDVARSAVEIPTLNSWGALLLGLGIAGAALHLQRRSRTA